MAGEHGAAGSARSSSASGHGVGLLGVVRPDEQEAERAGRARSTASMSSGDALLGHEAGDEADDDVVRRRGRARLGPRPRSSGVGGRKRSRSTPLPSSRSLPARRDAPAAHELEVLGVLHQLDVAEAAGDGLERVDDGRFGQRSSGAA